MFDSLSDSIFEAFKYFPLFKFGFIAFDNSQHLKLELDGYFPDALSSTNTANANRPAPQMVQSENISRVTCFHRQERNSKHKVPPGRSDVYVNFQMRTWRGNGDPRADLSSGRVPGRI